MPTELTALNRLENIIIAFAIRPSSCQNAPRFYDTTNVHSTYSHVSCDTWHPTHCSSGAFFSSDGRKYIFGSIWVGSLTQITSKLLARFSFFIEFKLPNWKNFSITKLLREINLIIRDEFQFLKASTFWGKRSFHYQAINHRNISFEQKFNFRLLPS